MKFGSPLGIAALADRFGLPPRAVEQLEAVLDLMSHDPHAPTTVTDRDEAANVHIADSLVALELPEADRWRSAADLGSGAGFPGLVLAIARPRMRVALVESSRRKCAYLARASARSHAGNAEVVCLRIEQWEAGRESCDLVTARALAPLAVVAEYAAPLLRPGGCLVAWKGRRDADEEHDAAAAASVLGLEPSGVFAVRPYAGSRDRHLHRFVKVADTPARFPRRPGMARKRPLCASSGGAA